MARHLLFVKIVYGCKGNTVKPCIQKKLRYCEKCEEKHTVDIIDI